MEIVFATNNLHKVAEIENAIGTGLKIKCLKDIGCYEELPENQNTLEGNAFEKAKYVYDNFNVDCFADDTGLEIDALNGEPGVLSARYSGSDKDAEANMQKVLQKMQNESNRNARFRTVISLIINGARFEFEGIVKGTILTAKSGKKGFGYDPIFQPLGYQETFAEMSMDLKNKISHRGLAVRKLVEFLNERYGK